MADKWRLIHPNHINAIVDGYEATIEHSRDRVGFTLDRRIAAAAAGQRTCCAPSVAGLGPAGPGAPARHLAGNGQIPAGRAGLAVQLATIVARNFTWKMTDGFKDASRAKVR